MADRAAASLLRGAGRAGWQFVVEVAVSSVATLCVTLVLSGWFRPGTAPVASPEVAPASAGSPVNAYSPVMSGPLRAVDASATDVPVNRPLLVERDVAEKEKPAATRVLEPVPVISASSPRPRSPSRLAKAAPHNAQAPCAPACSGHSMSEASAKLANSSRPCGRRRPIRKPRFRRRLRAPRKSIGRRSSASRFRPFRCMASSPIRGAPCFRARLPSRSF